MKVSASLLVTMATATMVSPLTQAVDIQPLIVGGRLVPFGQKTYTVGLRETELNVNFCGGSLISPTHVLTAAHCTGGRAKFISVGSHYLSGNKDGERIRVKMELRHPRFNAATMDYDFAIIELAAPASFAPVALYAADAETFPGETATVMGWGTTRSEGSQSKDLLRVDVPVVPFAVCRTRPLPFRITESMLCAGAVFNQDACQGDSGGPLVLQQDQQDVLIGVVSFGNHCGVGGTPGVYAKVSAVQSWIQSVVPQSTFV